MPIPSICISVSEPWYILETAHRKAVLLGRVAQIISSGPRTPEYGGAPMHPIDAPWLPRELPSACVYLQPSQLRPITLSGTTHRHTPDLAQA